MTFREGLVYVLCHAWLWPLEFWLRPLDVVDRFKQREQESAEGICALLGGALWGASVGVSVWLWTGEIQAIWSLAVAVAVAVTVADACAVAGAVDVILVVAGAVAGVVAVFGAVAGAVTGAVAVAVTVAVASVIAVAVTVAGASAVVAVAVAGVVAGAGTGAGTGAVAGAVAGSVAGAVAVAVAVAVAFAVAGADAGTGAVAVVFVGVVIVGSAAVGAVVGTVTGAVVIAVAVAGAVAIAVVGSVVGVLPVIGFVSLPQVKLTQVPILGISLTSSLTFGLLGIFFGDNPDIGFWTAHDKLNLRPVINNQRNWLIFFWILFPLLALIAWLPNPDISELNAKSNILVVFLLMTPVIFTGLVFWPILSIFFIWKFRITSIPQYTHERFASGLPFSWQTFAYPLPHLRKYLTELCLKHSPAVALQAIQAVQFRSLQMLAARRAALDLATHPDTALPFCGQLAMTTNTATLLPLGLAGHGPRAIAALAAKQEKEDKQPLRLYIADFPPKTSSLPFQRNVQAISWIEPFQNVRKQGLQVRLDYALKEIRLCPSGLYLSEFRTLLEALSNYTNTILIQAIKVLSQYPEKEANTSSAWLNEGWRVLKNVETILTQLEIYRELDASSARREFLEHKIEELQGLSWDGFSEYWGNISKELVGHWINLLTEEAKQAREWLRLEIRLNNENLTSGQQILQFQVSNPTATLARNIQIIMDALPGLEWHHAEAKRGILEGGNTALMSFELEAHEQGRYRITGRLVAEDISGNSFSLPFVFQVQVAQAGRLYRRPDYQPYVTGPGLGDDRTFAGRQDLLRWLRGLWLQPEGKAAVVLVGQRRIGKTSLLNKIKRDGLPDTGLLPVLINIQGVTGDYDFLISIAREMAAYLKASKPSLDRDNPYPDFKDFLLGLKSSLGQQRFLLMLDEADLIPQRKLGDLLPGFLRALMQEPEYPTLLLFCGTHALKRMSLEYSSILFNTAQFRTISYMSAAESADVLEKPARDILEFDPAVLDDAYRLTRGQPLLLQILGATLINRFNDIVRDGGERSNYVNLNDLNQAADELVRQGNAAFENHWEDSDPATHRVLSTLAWATDETNRLQLDLPGIEARMSEVRLALPAGTVFKIVERLADEEILLREGPTYRFAVPLYRRWIAWRWPPDRVREERLL